MGKRKLKHVAIPNLNTDLDEDETLSVIKTENDDEDCEPLYIVPNQVRDVVLEQISPKKERENQMSFDIEIGPVKIEHDLSSETFEMDSEESEQKQQNWWLKTCVDKNAKRKFFLEFIDAYRSCTALWDVKSQEFADRAQKETEYERLLIKYQEYYPNADVKEMQRKINAFRSNYKREQKRQNDLKSTAGDGESIRPTLYYFDAMSFINNDETPTCSSKGSMSLKEEEAEQPTKKQKISATENLMRIITQKLTQPDNEYQKEAEVWAMKLKKMHPTQALIAGKLINEVIFRGQLGNLTLSTGIISKPEHQERPVNSMVDLTRRPFIIRSDNRDINQTKKL